MQETTLLVLTPAALQRQLAGVILSRVMFRGKMELEAAQLVKFSTDDAAEFGAAMPSLNLSDMTAEPAAMLCLLKGENAIDTLADLLKNIEGCFGCKLAAAPATADENKAAMAATARIAARDNLLTAAPAAGAERTLLIIKPENFRQPSVRPGAIIDMLSSLDLQLVGCKVHGMTTNEALEFYGPVRQALRSKLGPEIGAKILDLTEKEFDFKFQPELADTLVETAGNGFADDQFEQIVEFMSGKRPSAVPESERDLPGGAKCMVLIFDGIDAVSKIRTILGPTNPAKATGGTVRYDFGTNIMVNASHASDAIESYEREGRIVKVNVNNLSNLAAALA
ncbi:MAG: hypothetical protein E7052_07835 [Lentisphaerae bacterium]|nr:hypothetical protein [Lentisphaerota bacterium]